jgi:bacteriorhodopsin
MATGAALLLIGAISAIALSISSGDRRWHAALAIWLLIGAGMSLVLTPVGRVLRRSSTLADRPAVFAAQFSLSHMCWLLTYPIAGWGATLAGFTATWTVLGVIATAGAVAALLIWPLHDPDTLTHTHDVATTDRAHLDDATAVRDSLMEHAHTFTIDQDHIRWPQPTR